MAYVVFRESHPDQGWIKGVRYPAKIRKDMKEARGIKGYVQVKGKSSNDTFYYPDSNLFTVYEEDLPVKKGLDKEIDDLYNIGYRDG